MGQPSIAVFVDNVGTPHTFVRLDDGNGQVNYYGFAPSTPGNPHGPGKIGRGLTTHALGDRDNSHAGFIDDVGWEKEIAVSSEQYVAMMRSVEEWDKAEHVYNGLGTLGGENCTTFVQNILRAGSVTEITTSRTSLPINLVPAAERRALFDTDADGRRSPSDALTDPLHTPGTPAYEYKRSHPELFETPPNSTPTKDPTHSELRLNNDGSFTETIRGDGDNAADAQTNEYNADGVATQSTQVDGAGNDADYASRTAAFDTQGRIDSLDVRRDDGTRDTTDYDQDSTQAWSRVESRFDAQGREDYANVFIDDGSRTVHDYDQTNARGDRVSQTHIDPQGRTDWTYATLDDGGHDWIDHDQTGARGDSVWQNRTDAQGREDWRYVTLDDGGHEWTDFDQAGARGDSSVQSRTDAWGRQDWVNIVQDDGSRDWTDHDQDGSQGWSVVTSRFDAWGRQDYANVYADDGSRDQRDPSVRRQNSSDSLAAFLPESRAVV
ncbi:hypothetical protein WDL1CHR_01544 [Variovorax sp. WDL1]|uniref:hypothetical protein n=1 Tax=Variovorax sp. WDL1 TaxID=207745 RepID=UPI00131605CF|nr:hypothetical protein [Variovorax sp. WDL1]VTV10598.1 hypothetical protein WDL1CHR_01544 [Variovorax sp. WDL1]